MRRESGQAGITALPLGLLTFVVGVLLVANAWAVIDAKIAVSAAAREATRAYVETPPGADPMTRADAAARQALQGAGRDPGRMRLQPLQAALVRCAVVRFEARYTVPGITVPWVGGYGSGFTASARHAEIVDPFRTSLAPSEAPCDAPG